MPERSKGSGSGPDGIVPSGVQIPPGSFKFINNLNNNQFMKREFLLFLILSFLFKILYCETFPIVSSPLEIKNYVNIYNDSDFAIYRFYIFNPTNRTFSYNIVSLSVDWIILYGKDNLDRFGTILPNQSKEILVYLRPKRVVAQTPTFIVSFRSEKGEINYTTTIILNPRIIYEVEKILPIKVENVEIYPDLLKSGGIFSIILQIANPNPFDLEIPIILNTSYGYKKEIKKILLPGNNLVKIESFIPSGFRSENFTLELRVGDIIIEKTLYLHIEEKTPIIEIKNNYIIIHNPYKEYLYYEFELPYSRIDLVFYNFYPKPFEYVFRDDKIYARWKIILLPGESYVIKKDLNYLSLLVILLIFSLLAIFLILILQPKVEIKKEIIRLSLEEKIMRVAIYIKNNGYLPINNVIIRDRVPENLKISKYDTVEPVGIYKEEKESVLEWSYDQIKPREEIIISYTLKIPEGVSKTLSIPNASITYNTLFGEKTEISNKISINIVE